MADTAMVSTPFGQFACFDGDLITLQLREFGAHQRSDLALLLSLIEPGDVILDIGAHIGTFAVPLARRVGPDGRVYAFEAVPEHYQLLRQNAELNGQHDTLVAMNAIVTQGIAAPRGTFYPGNTGAAKLSQSGEVDLHEVMQIALDDWWKSTATSSSRIDIVKIDVEGMEIDVLHSGKNMIDRERPIVVFEVAWHQSERKSVREMGKFFADRNYQLYINLHERNVSDDTFRIGRLGSLPWSRLMGLADVVAVPRDSHRHPPKVSSPPMTKAVILGRALPRLRRFAASRSRRLVRHLHARMRV